MDVAVLMSSGETDCWSDVDDALEIAGILYVVSKPGEETGKTMTLREETPQWTPSGTPTAPREEVTAWGVEAIYAPGMWMKVEFQ